jgi:hypothetical protein
MRSGNYNPVTRTTRNCIRVPNRLSILPPTGKRCPEGVLINEYFEKEKCQTPLEIEHKDVRSRLETPALTESLAGRQADPVLTDICRA